MPPLTGASLIVDASQAGRPLTARLPETNGLFLSGATMFCPASTSVRIRLLPIAELPRIGSAKVDASPKVQANAVS